MHLRPLAVLALIPTLLSSPAACAESQDSAWQFAVTPYVWLPHVSATLDSETPGSGGSPIEMQDLLKALKAALFLSGEARRSGWGVALDFVYCDFSKEHSRVTTVTGPGGIVEIPIDAGTTTSLTGSMLSLSGNHTLVQSPAAQLDLLAGLRYTHIGTTLDWSFAAPVEGLPGRSGSIGQAVDLWDGIVGARGRFRLGTGKWFVPYYLDAGAGTSKFTWQGLLGVGYAFSWGEALLVYRYLSFEQDDGKAVQRFSLAGSALGVSLRF